VTDAQHFTPTRAAGLRQLAAFVPHAGRAYAAKRNYDYGIGRHASVSVLSPYIRHRLITESEVVAAVLQAHTPASAEKFIQEVCWRTYWKGWLEQRPQVWDSYLNEVAIQRTALREDYAAAAEIAAAERGDTGLKCFDAWARELIDTGYLHNHARMWFASIWIFTLKLPWALGAAFFQRHLLDGDPASNTLSWRWVAGLHTPGKTYLARPDNIAQYTGGRFRPDHEDLAAFAVIPRDDALTDRIPLRPTDTVSNAGRAILLVTEEDLSPETWPLAGADVCGIALFTPTRDTAQFSPLVQAFKAEAMMDAEARAAAHWGQPVRRVTTPNALITFAQNQGAVSCVTAIMPVGLERAEFMSWSAACGSAGLPLLQIARHWDSLYWPHAGAGFFKLKERIPGILAKLGLLQAQSSA
jgi:deoxyribodipyrimidine photo-lyase